MNNSFRNASFICMSVPCLTVFLSVCLSVSQSVCLSVCLSDCLSVCQSVCLSVCQSACLSVCLSVCQSVSLSVYLFFCLFVCLSDLVCISLFLQLSILCVPSQCFVYFRLQLEMENEVVEGAAKTYFILIHKYFLTAMTFCFWYR